MRKEREPELRYRLRGDDAHEPAGPGGGTEIPRVRQVRQHLPQGLVVQVVDRRRRGRPGGGPVEDGREGPRVPPAGGELPEARAQAVYTESRGGRWH